MSWTAEAKVGAFTIIGVLLFVGIALFYGALRLGETGYAMHVDFDRVDGMKVGAQVRYSGIDIGRVVKLGVTPEGKARATMRIWTGNQIPEGSDFGIGSDGLLGEKYINISPPEQRKAFIPADTVVKGSPPQGLETFLLTADKLFLRLDKLVQNLEDVFGDPKVKTSLRETTRNIDELTSVLARMAVANETNINAVARNLLAMSGSLRDVAARVDRMTGQVDNDGRFGKDLTATLENLKSASARLEKMAAALEPVATDPETARNIKTTLKNAREVSERANKLLKKAEDIKTEAGFDIMGGGGGDRYRANIDLRIWADRRNFVQTGVSDIGETGRFNLQLGQDNGNIGGRLGVVEGKAGLGLDLHLGKNFKISADAYDPNDFRLKLRSELRLAPNTYLVGESISINKDAQRNSYVGIRRTF